MLGVSYLRHPSGQPLTFQRSYFLALELNFCLSHAFLYLYLLSGPKSAAQCIFLREVFTLCLGFIPVRAVVVCVPVPCLMTALCHQAASQGKAGSRHWEKPSVSSACAGARLCLSHSKAMAHLSGAAGHVATGGLSP